jgi:hypothetical protein
MARLDNMTVQFIGFLLRVFQNQDSFYLDLVLPERFYQAEISFVDDLSIVNCGVDLDSAVERSGRKSDDLVFQNLHVTLH